MLSSRPSPYYPDPINHHHNANTGIEFYRRSENGIRMPLGLSAPLLQDHYENGVSHGHMSRRTTPSSTDTDGRHASGPPRKRVPVACERCRKRKIKCSGDEGGGGCSNCRNAGLSGCHFNRVATIPDAGTYMAYRQELRTRTHGNHWHQGHHSHVHRYSPYSIPSPSLHYSRHPVSAYTSYASTSPTSYGPQSSSVYGADYSTPYSTGVSQGVSWTRTGSYSAYHGYDGDLAASAGTNAYGSHAQPASFLLPNTDPMSSNVNTSYNTMMYPYARSNSQVWTDQNLMATTYGAEANANAESAGASYESVVHPIAASGQKSDATVPYPLITNTSSLASGVNSASDRTLPTPGGRPYSQSHLSSALDNLPLSAVSHRSSVGWSTDSGSGASHVSSQTSLTGSTPGEQEQGVDRSLTLRAAQESQSSEYGYVGFNASPQATLPNNIVGVVEEAAMSYVHPAKHGAHFADAESSSSPTISRDLPSRNQRCRTISQESTPLQQSNLNSTVSGSTPTDTSSSSNRTVTNAVNKGSTSSSMAELGGTSAAPAYTTSIYNDRYTQGSDSIPNSHTYYSTRTVPASITKSSYRLDSIDALSAAAIQEDSSTQSSPKTLAHANNYRTYANSNRFGYTTTPHQASISSASSFPRATLVVPTPHSQTRGASAATAASGEGAGRLTSVSSSGGSGSASGSLSSAGGYGSGHGASARGSNGSSASMLSTYGEAAVAGDESNLGAGHALVGGQYGHHHPGRSSSGAFGSGISGGRTEDAEYSSSTTTAYPEKESDAVVGGASQVHAFSGRLPSRMHGDVAAMSEY